MVEPKHAAFELPVDLSPYLHQVDKTIVGHQLLLQSIGVKNKFEVSDLLDVMQNISRDTGSQQLSEDLLIWFGRATQHLLELDISYFDQEEFDLSLPNYEGFLLKATSLCIDDYEFVDKNESMKFVHQCIHQKAAKLLGVKGKRDVHLEGHISHFSSEFGQSEKLTTRLKRILSGYPCDSSVMKELLQNADDAGATELMFIKDFRHLPTKKVFWDEWASLQGPALCVFNDSFFTEDDFEGIQNLGVGSKCDDPVKTGQYGVGFNAVYHLTDVPSFITVGPGMEKSICALDPHMQYVQGCKSGKPGVKISQLDRIRDTYADSFSGYLEDKFRTKTKGTLFRFPLRTREMAKQSKIKDKKVDPDDVSKLLEEFKNDMFDSLLFLHNVKKISIASVNSTGNFNEEYWVKASLSEEDISEHKGFLSHLRKQTDKIRDPCAGIGLDAVSSLEAELSLSVEDSEGRQQDWIVFHHSGFSKEKPIPEPVNEAWENGDICLLPRGGVAVPLTTEGKSMMAIQGKAFCTLPLPITTGLPVHVNGHFAMDHEARRNLWHGNNDYRSIWNRHIVDAIIIPAYILAMQSLKKRTGMFKEKSLRCQYESLHYYYSFFPDRTEKTSGAWNDVVISFYSDIFFNKKKLFGIVKPGEGMFSDFSKEESKSNKTQKKEDMNCKVLWVPASCGKGYFNVLESLFPQKKTETGEISQSDTDEGKPLTVLFPQMHEFKQENDKAWQLTEILKDLNMNVIDVPCRIYENVRDICTEGEKSLVTPESVIQFLKSQTVDTKERCNLGSLPLELEFTSLKSIKSLELLTEFCEKHPEFGSELQSLPLALTESQQLHCFDATKPLFVTTSTHLFYKTPDMVLHNSLTHRYKKYLKDSDCIKDLDVTSLACLTEQTFSKDVLRTGKPVLWKDSNDLPTKKWIFMFWDYLSQQICNKRKEQTFDTQEFLAELDNWSLFPARKQGESTLLLYGIKNSKCVIYRHHSHKHKSCETALLNMKVPMLETSLFHPFTSFSDIIEVTSSFAASVERPDSILKLLSDFDFNDCPDITADDSLAVLEYFSVNIEKLFEQHGEQSAQQLRRLPIYESMSGQQVALQDDSEVFAVEEYTYIPPDGFSELIRTSGVLFLKKHVACRNIYEKLNIETKTRVDLYANYILPNFECMSSSAQLAHLKFLRDTLLPFYEELSEPEGLIDRLRELRFIEANEGLRKCASNFFSPSEEVFKVMCDPSVFPPSPYDEPIWQRFLICAGLKTDVCSQQYLTYAREVEDLGSKGITEDVCKKSNVLCNYLKVHHERFQEQLSQIGKIKFLLPHTVEKELTAIHPQLDDGKHLVSYCESLAPDNCHCIWTSRSMFHKDTYPLSWKCMPNTTLCSALGIRTTPDPKDVTTHLQNISRSFEEFQNQNSGERLFKLRSIVERVMKSIYKYLQEAGVSDLMKQQLKDFCTIYIPEKSCMVPASEVVKRIRFDEIVDGYVYGMPDTLNDFWKVLLELGASEEAHANLYACVLEKLYKQTHKQKLEENDLLAAEKAIKLMFTFMKVQNKTNTPMLEVPTLYLPDANLTLTDSCKLVFIDNEYFSERVQSLDLQYFLGFEKFPDLNSDPLRHINMLPEGYQLTMLSSLVQENVTDESKLKACPHQLSQEYMEIIHESEFVCAVMRLVNHELLRHNQHLDQTEAKAIEEQLRKLEIHQVENLHTELRKKDGIQIPRSEDKKRSMEEHFNAKVYLFIDNDIDSDDLCCALTSTVDSLTSNRLGNSSYHINHLLKSNPETYQGHLDEDRIWPYNHVCEMRENIAFPIPGTLIPEDMHWLLDNNFHAFDEWEYVGLEVYDPVIDTDAKKGDDEEVKPEYIYALVKKILPKETSWIRGQYLVTLKNGHLETIPGTKLYKIWNINQDKNSATEEMSTSLDELLKLEHRDLKKVLREIRDILTETWRTCTDPKERNRIKKRLYLNWHPDKNLGEETFCTEVCQYIQLYVTKLDNGQIITDDGDVDDMQSHSSFFEHMKKRSSHQRDQYKQWKQDQTFDKRHHSARNKAHPQPQEAKRWLRQASCDLGSARDTLHLGRDFNWVCFKALKAAEKAVTAVWYNRNAYKAEKLRKTGIIKAAAGLENVHFSEFVTQLQNIVGDYDRMHFPDRLTCPRIPADVFTESTATQACQLAETVLILAEEM